MDGRGVYLVYCLGENLFGGKKEEKEKRFLLRDSREDGEPSP